MDAIEFFADHVADTRFADLPPDAVQAAHTFILDSFGVGMVGSAAPQVDELYRAAASWGSGADARVWVSGARLPAPQAAFMNAYQTHNSEFDCVHEAAVVHCVTVVLAGVMAVAEREKGFGGKDLITAVTLGVDTACNLGIAATAGLRFFRPATAGLMGAAMAIGKLLGFGRERLIQTCSIAYAQAGGTMQAHTEGSLLLAVQMAFAARNAVAACDLAAQGVEGPRNIIEGPFGYLNLIEASYDLGDILPNLGKVWRIAEVAHKPFPSGRATHGVVDACLGLRAEHNLDAGAIASVSAKVPPLTHHLVGRPPKAEMSPNYARLCASYVAARALTHGTVEVSHFTPEFLRDGVIGALAKQVEIVIDGNPDPNALSPVTVDIELTNGGKLTATREVIYGNPGNPMSREDYLDKFRRNCAGACPGIPAAQAEALIGRVEALEEETEIASLVDLVIAPEGTKP
jgi:2-methylcitrate dehydratase PrpD